MTQSNDIAVPSGPSIEPPMPRPRPATSRWLVVTLGILSAFGPVSIDMYLPAFPQIARDLGASTGAVQLTLSLFLVGFAGGQLLWGTLSDHFGRRLPLLVGCLSYTLAALLCSASGSITGLIAARFLMGLGGSAGVVVSRAVVRDLFDENASARFYSLMMIIGGVAPIVAPTMGGFMLAYANWRAIFWVIGGFGVICAAAVAVDLPETLPREYRARGHVALVFRRYAALLVNPKYIGFAVASGFSFGVLFAYISSSSFVFIQIYGVSPQRFGLFFGSNAIGLYCAGQLNRWLLRRFASRQILVRACIANAAVAALLVVVAVTGFGGFWAFFLTLFLCVASLGLIFPNIVAAAMRPVAEVAGSASALLGMLQYATGAVSGGLIGVLHTGTAIPMVAVIAISSLFCALTLVLFAERHAA
jgi:MFS transporter, DHA1 family, multidrug resistance protein